MNKIFLLSIAACVASTNCIGSTPQPGGRCITPDTHNAGYFNLGMDRCLHFPVDVVMSPSCQPLGGVVSPGLTSYRVRQALKIPEIVVMIELTMLLESFGIERSKIPGAIGKTVKEITPLSGIRATLRECGYNPSRGFLEVADSISFLEWIGCNALLLLLDEEFHGSCNLYDKGIASKVVANCIARTISELQPPLGISEVTVPQTPEIPALAESPRCGEIPDSPIHATLDALKSGTPSSVTSPNL